MLKIIKKIPTVDEYNKLADSVGWGKREDKIVKEALKNSVYCVCAYEEDELVGFGRIVGDKTIFLYLQDVMIDPQYQRKGIGTKIIENILNKINDIRKTNPNIRLYLFARKGKEEFYEKFGFIRRPNSEYGAGMILKNN